MNEILNWHSICTSFNILAKLNVFHRCIASKVQEYVTFSLVNGFLPMYTLDIFLSIFLCIRNLNDINWIKNFSTFVTSKIEYFGQNRYDFDFLFLMNAYHIRVLTHIDQRYILCTRIDLYQQVISISSHENDVT